MARLTQDDRRNILRALMRPYRKEEQKKKEAIEKWLTEFCDRLLPQDFQIIAKKYPAVVRFNSNMYVGNFKWKPKEINYLKVSYVSYFCDRVLKNLEDKKLIELCEDYDKYYQNNKVLEKRLLCALQNITTENRLKNEFPEAYNVYLNLDGVEKEETNACDSIENVRALLSKKP